MIAVTPPMTRTPLHLGTLQRAGKLFLALMLTLGICLGTAGIGAGQAAAELPGPTDGGRAIITESTTEEVAAGITQSHYERIDPEGRNRIDVLEVDLSRNTPNYLDTGKVAASAPSHPWSRPRTRTSP